MGADQALAASRPDVQPDARKNVQQDISRTEQSIKAGKARQRALVDQARLLHGKIDALRVRAALVANQTQREEAALNVLDERLKSLRSRDQDYRRRLQKMRDSITQSIIALARLERQPAAIMLAAPGTILDAARGGRLLAAALPALYRDVAEVGKLLAKADKVRNQLGIDQQSQRIAVATLSARRQELDQFLDERARFERQLQRAGAQESIRLAMLAAKAGDLRGLMRRLEQDNRQNKNLRRQRAEKIAALPANKTPVTVTQRTQRNIGPKPNSKTNKAVDLKAADLAPRRAAQQRRKLAADMARVLGSAAAAQNQAAPNEEEQNEEARKPARAGDGGRAAGRLALLPGASSVLPFSRLRGHLRSPARGRRVDRYGESNGFGARVQGITLLTRQGAQVVAPYDGRVVFAGPFRNYGLILIISHGEGYHTLLAGLSKLQANVGQLILTGEPVGIMGGDDRRSLYFELRRKGTAINPNPWWSSSRERASG